jgi:nicotinate-nucleotide adenylyltransferase
LAQEALWRLGLGEVVLVPTGQAPHKRIADDPGRELRLAMTRLAAAEDARFTVSTLEVEREGPSYTYETLELLAEQRDSQLVFVMGADAAVGLESWREPQRVVQLAHLAIARRAGVAPAEVAAVLATLCAATDRVTMLEMPEFGISSSAVRERAKDGGPLRYMVPEAVARFVQERSIYTR